MITFYILFYVTNAIQMRYHLDEIQLPAEAFPQHKTSSFDISQFIKILIFFVIIVIILLIIKFCIRPMGQTAIQSNVAGNNLQSKKQQNFFDEFQYKIIVSAPDKQSVSARDKDRLEKENSLSKDSYALFQRKNIHKWTESKHIGNKKHCQICPSVNKTNNWPIIRIHCPSKHLFHMDCIKQFLHEQFKANNEEQKQIVHKCPTCKQKYPETFTMICPQCQFMTTEVNSKDFTDKKGKLKVAQIMYLYGGKCHMCNSVS